MKWKDLIKDRWPAYLFHVMALVLVMVFMRAFRISVEMIAIVGVILFLALVSAELWEFLRRKAYYDKLTNCLNELDKKYFISEMIDPPSFYDGQMLYETLRAANKSMLENIGEYRRGSKEFREYIELWVHEVKLPVASLQLMCLNDGSTKYVRQLRRIDEYIENVLYYARSGNAERDYIIKAVSLKRAFSDTALRFRTELQDSGVTIITRGLDVSVMTDSKWLEYIIGQLIGNSIKYFSSDRKPEITVYAEELPDKTLLHFRDNGIGIPESDLPYIFEKSFTGENGRTHTKSTGMGLYIVKKLCVKLGHAVSAGSVQGDHTEISIAFGNNDLHAVR